VIKCVIPGIPFCGAAYIMAAYGSLLLPHFGKTPAVNLSQDGSAKRLHLQAFKGQWIHPGFIVGQLLGAFLLHANCPIWRLACASVRCQRGRRFCVVMPHSETRECVHMIDKEACVDLCTGNSRESQIAGRKSLRHGSVFGGFGFEVYSAGNGKAWSGWRPEGY